VRPEHAFFGNSGAGVLEIHNVWRVPFNPTDPINTPSGLNMGDASVVAVGMLTYGQSSDPASPFAYDQLEPFSRKQWPALPFHRSDIEAQRIGPQLVIVR